MTGIKVDVRLAYTPESGGKQTSVAVSEVLDAIGMVGSDGQPIGSAHLLLKNGRTRNTAETRDDLVKALERGRKVLAAVTVGISDEGGEQ